MKDIKKLEKALYDGGVTAIVTIAVNNWIRGWDSVVFFNPSTEKFEGEPWTTNTRLHPESELIEVYRLRGSSGPEEFESYNEILTDDEYEELIEKIMERDGVDREEAEEDCGWYDQEDLNLIDIDLNERWIEALLDAPEYIIDPIEYMIELNKKEKR